MMDMVIDEAWHGLVGLVLRDECAHLVSATEVESGGGCSLK